MTKTLTYGQYCHNSTVRRNAGFIIYHDRPPVWVVEGEELSLEEMDKRYPVDAKILPEKKIRSGRGDDIDGTRAWRYQ